MAGVVVDASVAAAWFLPDEATPFTEAALEACAHGSVWVPSLWLLEMGNLFISAQRRKSITATKRKELVLAASALPVRIDREPVSMADLDALCAQHNLTTYDAMYLELAIRRALPMATLDAALRQAMTTAGVASFEIPG